MSCLVTHSCFDNLVCSWVVVSWAVRQPSTVKRVLNSVPLHPAIPVIHAASSWRKWKAPIMWQWPKPDGLGQHLGGLFQPKLFCDPVNYQKLTSVLESYNPSGWRQGLPEMKSIQFPHPQQGYEGEEEMMMMMIHPPGWWHHLGKWCLVLEKPWSR